MIQGHIFDTRTEHTYGLFMQPNILCGFMSIYILDFEMANGNMLCVTLATHY